MGQRICICTICGLPGSGKTCLCEKLVYELMKDYLVIHIHYDKILLSSVTDEIKLHESLVKENQDKAENGLFKASRNQILKLVEVIIKHVTIHGSVFDLETVDELNSVNKDVKDSFLHSCKNSLTRNFENNNDVLLLIDDNLFLTSMRYDFYKLAKQYETGFCEIYMDLSVERSLERNKTRKGQNFVSESTIHTMSQKFEPPDPIKNYWEKYNIKVNAEDTTTVVYSVIRSAFANPAQPTLQVDEKEQAQSKAVCSQSLIHQADLILRKCVTKSISDSKSVSKDVRRLSKQAMEVKDRMMNALKNRQLNIPFDESLFDIKDASKDENSDFYKYIYMLFSEKLKLYDTA